MTDLCWQDNYTLFPRLHMFHMYKLCVCAIRNMGKSIDSQMNLLESQKYTSGTDVTIDQSPGATAMYGQALMHDWCFMVPTIGMATWNATQDISNKLTCKKWCQCHGKWRH